MLQFQAQKKWAKDWRSERVEEPGEQKNVAIPGAKEVGERLAVRTQRKTSFLCLQNFREHYVASRLDRNRRAAP
jgi:hypothetical protein